MRLARSIFFSFILLAQPAWGQSQEELLNKEMDRIEVDYDKDPVQGLRDVDKLLNTADRKIAPKAWLRAFYFMLGDKDHPALTGMIDEAVALAEANKLPDLQVEIMLFQTGILEAKESIPTVRNYYQKIMEAAERSEDRTLVVRVASNQGSYLYSVNQIPAGLQVVYSAMDRMVEQKATDTPLFNSLKETLGILILASGDIPKAIRIWEECTVWAQKNNLPGVVASNAYNIANALIKLGEKDDAKIIHYFDLAMKTAEESHDENSVGTSLYGKGKLALARQRYQESVELFDKARPIFFKTQNPNFAAMCLVYKTQALVGLNRLKEAREVVEAADKELKDDVKFGKMLILESRHAIAEKEGDFPQAHLYLKRYLAAWKAQKEEEEAQQMQKLSTSLGLKLEEERNRNLQDVNSAQGEKLQEAERFRLFVMAMGGVSLLALVFLVYALMQSKKVAQSRKKMQRTLDNIDEGLLTVNSNLRISREYSKHLTTLLQHGEEPGGADFVDCIFKNSDLSDERKSMVREVLKAAMGEDELAFFVNEHLLPLEIVLGEGDKTWIAVRWVPILNQQSRLTHVLVSLQDVTKQRQLEQALNAQKQQLQALPHLVREIRKASPERYLPVLKQTEETLRKLANPIEASAMPDIFARLHTAKGNARMLGLKSLSEQLHDLESAVLEDRAAANLPHVHQLLAEYREWTSALHDETISVQKTLLYDCLRPLIPGWIQHLQDSGLVCQEISVVDRILTWPEHLLELLPDLLMHAVNNSLEHGFIFPHQNGQSTRPPALQISGSQSGDVLRLEIRDNGQGLDWKKLQALAQERKFVPKEGQTVADIVFSDGITTADRLTVTSGRGVGLAAIRRSCEEQAGRIGISDNDRELGTLLWLEFPLQTSLQTLDRSS